MSGSRALTAEAAGRVALDDEQLALSRFFDEQSFSLSGMPAPSSRRLATG